MTDPRLTPDPALVEARTPASLVRPITDLCRTPKGPRDRQLLLGASVKVLSQQGGWSYVQAKLDGYCGYVETQSLGAETTPSHRISNPASHVYLRADMKSPDQMPLSFGCTVTVLKEEGSFVQTPQGFIPRRHVKPISEPSNDPTVMAEMLVGTPYLWGGNSRQGIDCSGLVQMACIACNIPCPGDADMQEASVGTALPNGTPLQRNDLLFWKGHVAIVCSPKTLIHANAHTMSVSYEPIAQAITRIAQTDGPVTAHKRLL
ncbi:NLP/P60 hydrolase [Sulfitobacter sp. SK012]|uniref:C40 family peptidase n=1 Tax=Sulfitobacter sp. SK012 TaxID=1389005 RepID=UPI000E0C03FD|nr:NlpC/P60 family protein [Sulfitobacter sp. SK012]AXI44864.1 NLP/P60 hydrolase [Sulfitobacter sp. SK012]